MDSRTAIRMTIFILLLLGLIYLLWLVRGGLYPFVVAFFIAYLLNPAVRWLESKNFTRARAIVAIYVVLFSTIFIGGSLLIPFVLKELESFGKELPLMIDSGEALLKNFQWAYQNSTLPLSLRMALDNSLLTLQKDAQGLIAAMVNGILAIVSNFIGIAITPILAFYLLDDWDDLGRKILRFAPGNWRGNLLLVMRDMDKVLAGVIRGQLIIALIVGVLVSIGLHLLGVHYALVIGILAGMLDIIPYFGAFIGAAPAITAALLVSPALALKVLLLFTIIHQLEGVVIGPRIIGCNVGLQPLSVVFFLFVGEEVGGLLGMLLGVPLAAIAKVIIKHVANALI